ncbi:MAG: hypothetical protein ACHRXM_39715, partial [Isosphaerales bacterium]
MADLNPSGTGKTGSSKKTVSPARNVIYLVIILAAGIVAWFEFSAKFGYNAAVKALDARTRDEEKTLMSVQEAESLLGKSPDGPGSDLQEAERTYTKKTYTWPGLFRSYTLTAFYTKEKDSRLHHFETEGEKYAPEPTAAGVNATPIPAQVSAKAPGHAPRKAAAPVPTKTPTSIPAKTDTPAPAKADTPA